jgi:putative addiction module killer protein
MIEVRQTAEFARWLRRLADAQALARIVGRIRRIEQGNFGDVRSLGAGLMEMRIDHGPGYRVYFVRRGDMIVILLSGGDKRSQTKDIEKARRMAKEY